LDSLPPGLQVPPLALRSYLLNNNVIWLFSGRSHAEEIFFLLFLLIDVPQPFKVFRCLASPTQAEGSGSLSFPFSEYVETDWACCSLGDRGHSPPNLGLISCGEITPVTVFTYSSHRRFFLPACPLLSFPVMTFSSLLLTPDPLHGMFSAPGQTG